MTLDWVGLRWVFVCLFVCGLTAHQRRRLYSAIPDRHLYIIECYRYSESFCDVMQMLYLANYFVLKFTEKTYIFGESDNRTGKRFFK